jgi:hypothetical protein
MEIGDLVKQKSSGVAVISAGIKNALNMGCVGIIVSIEEGVYFSYDGRSRGNITVHWSNGATEVLPEIYLEKIENE